jgi:hypothetical protein
MQTSSSSTFFTLSPTASSSKDNAVTYYLRNASISSTLPWPRRWKLRVFSLLCSDRIPLTISVSLMTDVSHVCAISSVSVPTAILVARRSSVCIPPIVLATWWPECAFWIPQGSDESRIVIFRHYLPVPGVGNLRACCLVCFSSQLCLKTLLVLSYGQRMRYCGLSQLIDPDVWNWLHGPEIRSDHAVWGLTLL